MQIPSGQVPALFLSAPPPPHPQEQGTLLLWQLRLFQTCCLEFPPGLWRHTMLGPGSDRPFALASSVTLEDRPGPHN